VVGLFAPPLLAATAIGAAMGAVSGKALHKRTGSKIEESASETIPIGGAGLIVAYKHADAETVERAVTRAVKKVGEAEGHHLEALGHIRLAGERSCADDQAVDTTARATFGWRHGTTTSRAPTREGA
jgi:Protein of unknown function (DUF1269)